MLAHQILPHEGWHFQEDCCENWHWHWYTEEAFSWSFHMVFFWVEPTINEVLGRYNIERMIFHKTHAGSTSISTVNIVYMGWLGQQKMNGCSMIFQSTHHPNIRAILRACLKRGEASPSHEEISVFILQSFWDNSRSKVIQYYSYY